MWVEGGVEVVWVEGEVCGECDSGLLLVETNKKLNLIYHCSSNNFISFSTSSTSHHHTSPTTKPAHSFTHPSHPPLTTFPHHRPLIQM